MECIGLAIGIMALFMVTLMVWHRADNFEQLAERLF